MPLSSRRLRTTVLTATLAAAVTCSGGMPALAAPAPDTSASSTRLDPLPQPPRSARVSEVYEVDVADGTWVITVREDQLVSVVLREQGTGERTVVTPEVREQIGVQDPAEKPIVRPSKPPAEPTSTSTPDPKSEEEPAEDDPETEGEEPEGNGDDPAAAEDKPAEGEPAEGEEPGEGAPAEDEESEDEESEDVPEVVEEIEDLAGDEDGAERTDGATASMDLDASWEAAWAKMLEEKDESVLEDWAKAQAFGPDPETTTEVYDGPSKVSSQAHADAMSGKKVTKDITFAPGKYTVSNVYFAGGRIDQQQGDVTYRDILMDAQNGTEFPNYWRIGKGASADLERVEIRGNQDGLQTYAEDNSFRLRYVYIHSPSPTTGGLKGNNTHQDGLQHMGGHLDMSRTIINYTGGKQSVMMLKLDHGDGSMNLRENLFVRNGKIMWIWDNGSHQWSDVKMEDNVVAGKPGASLTDMWQLNDKAEKQLAASELTSVGTGAQVPIKHQVKLR
jgi:hypothetical protein